MLLVEEVSRIDGFRVFRLVEVPDLVELGRGLSAAQDLRVIWADSCSGVCLAGPFVCQAWVFSFQPSPLED